MAAVPTAASKLASRVRARFGDRVTALKLFGSRARGEAREDSDIDVLVVVAGLTSAEAREIAFMCGDVLTEDGVVVSAFALSQARFQELVDRQRRIALEIARDGVPL